MDANISLDVGLSVFLADQQRASFVWDLLSGRSRVFLGDVSRAITSVRDERAVEDRFGGWWEKVSDDRYARRLEYVFHERRSQPLVDVKRLVLNSRALVATGAVAGLANLMFRGRPVSGASIEEWVSRCFGTDAEMTNTAAFSIPDLTERHAIEKFLDRVVGEGDTKALSTSQAACWILFWLGRGRTLEKGMISIPIVSLSGLGSNAIYSYLRISDLSAGGRLGLIEHPEMALVAFDSDLLDGIDRAWASSPTRSVCWSIDRPPAGVVRGDSFSGAAAVGMRFLSNGGQFDPSTLILARLGSDLQTLKPVANEVEKLSHASRIGVSKVILPSISISRDRLTVIAKGGIAVREAARVADAEKALINKSEEHLMEMGTHILRRYKSMDIVRQDDLTTLVTAVDDEALYLVKTWPYLGESSPLLLRALWDGELRNLYRLSSSPHAEESLLTMKDAGIDEAISSFVVVLHGAGYQSYVALSTALGDRGNYQWLQKKQLEEDHNRYALWEGLRRIAAGIDLLHKQDVMHRNVGAESIYFDPDLGPDSLRLAGFEWSLRLGSTPTFGATQTWPIPPENRTEDGARYTFEADWYGFGMLIARCFHAIEDLSPFSGSDLNHRVMAEVENSSGMADLERALLRRLIALNPADRLAFGVDILKHLDAILEGLRPERFGYEDTLPLVLVIPSRDPWLIDAATNAGFRVDEGDPTIEYDYDRPSHVASLKDYIRTALRGARLYPVPGKPSYILDTNEGLTLSIMPHVNQRSGDKATWHFAFARGESWFGKAISAEHSTDLEGQRFNVVIPSEVDENLRHKSWESVLPIVEAVRNVRGSLYDFHQFLRCTNQLELLMSSSEIFSVEIEMVEDSPDGEFEFVRLKETDKRPYPDFTRKEGGMTESIQSRIDSNLPYSRRFLLTDTDSIRVGGVELERDAWEVVDNPDRQERTVLLTRRKGAGLALFEKEGFIRSSELYGQFRLLERRKRAIDELEKHSYLLRSLVQPGMVRIDTGPIEHLPYDIDAQEIDASKAAILRDILRVRPIYALQGPPGTGKTTLVSYLLREILEQDPVAQILVTAQAHGAVDVLREKVQKQAFGDTASPLAIRIGVDSDGTNPGEGTVREVTRGLLERVQEDLSQRDSLSDLQREWLESLPELIAASNSSSSRSELSDMEQLVRLGASITYCTTSSGDLETLVSGNQAFDWCVVEEAGKAHGFDLALPLQTAHRWLLLGDYKQLPPHRIEDFKSGLMQLDAVVEALEAFPNRDFAMIDYEWIDDWRERQSRDDRGEPFVKHCLYWVETFRALQANLSRLKPADEHEHEEEQFRGLTTDYSKGAWSGQLTAQYRMHPDIGDLISATFYGGSVANKTVDPEGNLVTHVRHGLETPEMLADRSLVWLDTRWSANEPDFAERGPDNGNYPRFTNTQEAELIRDFLTTLSRPTGVEITEDRKTFDIAILSPYAQQVALINETLRDFKLPEGFQFRQAITGRRRQPGSGKIRAAHTVDSFQGNQADIVIVSLVRNNDREKTQRPLGFMDNPKRLNVLLSRAERLMVLVGSWDFFMNAVEFVNEDDNLAEWKSIMTFLDHSVSRGLALRVPFNGFSRSIGEHEKEAI